MMPNLLNGIFESIPAVFSGRKVTSQVYMNHKTKSTPLGVLFVLKRFGRYGLTKENLPDVRPD